ncbi:MAG: potassium-transporting ATPase subunit KdpC [Candidatus Methanoperedens sp.]|nr:potassium-transporting ATPase subunit KdpC [Candidatus Methanoperedens sp.]MCZ7370963.1 potassium-transporting ATPase subunit KdpC [Candidatus Methanoperedens sp.]
MKNIKTTLKLFAILMVLVGVIYPVAVTVLSQLFFPKEAGGSLLYDSGGNITGSALIGQPFSDPKYFWPRPSVTSGYPYNPLASGGSNLGPTNKDLIDQISNRTELLKSSGIQSPVPSDLVEASASGLDPHISVQSTLVQIPRVARARNLSEDTLNKLVVEHIENRQFGFLGEQRINVLELNLALDSMK